MKLKILTILGLILAISLFAAACGSDDDGDDVSTGVVSGSEVSEGSDADRDDDSSPPTTQAPREISEFCTEDRKGGEINFGVFSETSGLDPTVTSGSGVTGAIELSAIYGTLVLQDPATGGYYPWLAESLEPNAASDVWTLTLRDDVTFGNGDKMTTAHVRDSLNRFVATEKNPAQRNQSGAWVAYIEEMVIMDDLTMEFRLDAPWGGFPYTLADESGMIINTAILEERGFEEFNRNPAGAGAGPYEFVRYAPQDEIVLEAKDDWWGGPVCIERLRFTRVGGSAATYEAYQAGELQGAFLREAPTVADARENGDDNALIFLKSMGGVVMVNNGIRGSTPPTTDVRLRRAVSLATDAGILNERADQGKGNPHKGIIHSNSVYYDAALLPELETNLDEARRLVEEVKAEGNWDGTIRLDCHNAPSRVDWALAFQGLLESVGFDVDLTNDGTINDLIGAVLINADYDLACWGFNLGDLEPLESLLQHTCTSSSNRTGYCDPRMDDAVAQVRAARSPQEFTDAYAAVWSVWQETIPSVPVNLTEEYVLFDDNVKGVIGSQASIVLFHRAYIEN